MAFNVSSLWQFSTAVDGSLIYTLSERNVEREKEVAECDGMSAGERAFAFKQTWGLDRGFLSLSLFGSHTQLESMIRSHHVPVPEPRARATAETFSGFQAKGAEPEKPRSSPLEFESLGIPKSFEELYSGRREEFKKFIVDYFRNLAEEVAWDSSYFPNEELNRTFLNFVRFLGSDESRAVGYLRRHQDLAFAIGQYILRSRSPEGDTQNFIRLQRFVRAHRGLFVLPSLYVDPANTLDDSITRRYSELDDIDIAWEYLRVQFSLQEGENEEEQAVRTAFENGGFLYCRLCAALESDIYGRRAIFSLPEIRNGFDVMRRDEVPEPIRIFRLLNSGQLLEIIRKGYDTSQKKGPYIFSPESGFSASVFARDGVSKIKENIIVGITHEIEWFTFAAFLAVGEGEAYATDEAISMEARSARLFSAMMDEAVIQTSVDVYACGVEQRHGLELMKWILLEDFNVTLDLGQRLEDVVGIPNPETMDLPLLQDFSNETLYFYNLLFCSSKDLQRLFEAMLDENPKMALRAKSFYASMPFFTMPIIFEWLNKWENVSAPLQIFLFGTLRAAAKVVQTFTSP